MKCIVTGRFKDGRYDDLPERTPGDIIDLDDEDRIERWSERDLIYPIGEEVSEFWPWGEYEGRNLPSFSLDEESPDVVVFVVEQEGIGDTLESIPHYVDVYTSFVEACQNVEEDEVLLMLEAGDVIEEFGDVPAMDVGRARVRDGSKTEDQFRLYKTDAEEPVDSQVAPIQIRGRVENNDSLKILQLSPLDAGMVMCRLHHAINAYTRHESIMATSENDRPFNAAYQYDIDEHREILQKAAEDADIIHSHLRYHDMVKLGLAFDRPIIIHHHGTMIRENPEKYEDEDTRRANMRLISNLELFSYAEDAHYLPNPVEVARHRKLETINWDDRPFVVSHSPSKREKKGTDEFLQAIDELQEEGLNVKAKLIEGQPHSVSCREKAASHACFDSFWLGMQCSGLEAAASSVPVLAGDTTVRERYRNWIGSVPYTFADNKEQLKTEIRKLASDKKYWAQEARRVYEYTRDYHDQSQVAEKYMRLASTITR